MTDPYEEDLVPRKKVPGNADLLEYRIEALEREVRISKGQHDRRAKEITDVFTKRFDDMLADYQKGAREIAEALEKKTKETTAEIDRRSKELTTEHKALLKDTEADFDKRTSRIESFLLGGLCLVATLFIGALFAITNGSVPGGPG
jgi:Mg2+ and Co2+ transporter CorA